MSDLKASSYILKWFHLAQKSSSLFKNRVERTRDEKKPIINYLAYFTIELRAESLKKDSLCSPHEWIWKQTSLFSRKLLLRENFCCRVKKKWNSKRERRSNIFSFLRSSIEHKNIFFRLGSFVRNIELLWHSSVCSSVCGIWLEN